MKALGQGGGPSRPRHVTGAGRRVAELLTAPEAHRPVFQPILSLTTGAVVGYEGFSRFATEPLRPPDHWFAEATRVGLGAELQALAIDRLLGEATRAGLPNEAFVSINVSPRYLAHTAVVAAMRRADPRRLVIEITEEEPVDDYAALRRSMAPHLERGARFAVDDAGAGFASMRHVTELAPAYVKLDAALVRGMRSRATLRAFVRALNEFAREIGAAVIAEGVEETSDLAALTRMHFPLLAQGYAIARPGPPWPSVSEAARRAWDEASRERDGEVQLGSAIAVHSASERVGGTTRVTQPVDHGVNIGVVLAAGLRGVQIDTLDALRSLGAVAAWKRLRATEPALATPRTLLALEGAIRGVRWTALSDAERQELGEGAAGRHHEPAPSPSIGTGA